MLNDITLPPVVPPLPRDRRHARNLPREAAFDWLRAGWKDYRTNPASSLMYGIGVFLGSLIVIWMLFRLDLGQWLFPALAGFMVIGPLIANGLYEKSRRLETGEKTGFMDMVLVKPKSRYQAHIMGVLLLCLFMLWIRAAVLIWALFFGLVPYPGADEILPMLFTTATGWGLLIVGGGVGALFAAFAFAISVFAVPMLLEEKTDAMTALGTSMAMVWCNLPVMLTWGAIVLVLFAISVATGLLGLIIVFPLLGHATWHAYRGLRRSA